MNTETQTYELSLRLTADQIAMVVEALTEKMAAVMETIGEADDRVVIACFDGDEELAKLEYRELQANRDLYNAYDRMRAMFDAHYPIPNIADCEIPF